MKDYKKIIEDKEIEELKVQLNNLEKRYKNAVDSVRAAGDSSLGTGVLLHYKNRKKDPELAEEALDGSVAKAMVVVYVILVAAIIIGLISSNTDDEDDNYNYYSNSVVYYLNGV